MGAAHLATASSADERTCDGTGLDVDRPRRKYGVTASPAVKRAVVTLIRKLGMSGAQRELKTGRSSLLAIERGEPVLYATLANLESQLRAHAARTSE